MSFDSGWLIGDVFTAIEANKIGQFLITDETKGSAGATFDFTSISGNYFHLFAVLYSRTTSATTGTALNVTFNNDTGANYNTESLRADGTTATAAQALAGTAMDMGPVPGSTSPANSFGMAIVWIPHYAGSANHKVCRSSAGGRLTGSSGGIRVQDVFGHWASTAAITRVTFTPGAGNFDVGSRATLYGLK